MGKIYVAWDSTKPNLAKVGMTTREAFVRVAEAENPDYMLFDSFEVSNEVLEPTEKDIHEELSKHFTRRKHQSYDGLSEWFEGTPEKVADKCEEFLKQGVSIDELRKTITDLTTQITAVNHENEKLVKSNIYLKEKYESLNVVFNSLKDMLRELSHFDGTNPPFQKSSDTNSRNKHQKSVRKVLDVLRGKE